MKRLKATLCLLLCLILLLSSCGKETDVPQQTQQETQGEIQQEITGEVITTDTEILKAIDLGFVPESLQGDYDSQISYAEFCSILDNFVSVIFSFFTFVLDNTALTLAINSFGLKGLTT